MLLYGSTDSGHSYKVRSFLLLAGVPHTYRWIELATPRAERPPDFVAASKFGEVPVLVDDGRPLCQSNAILIHLAQKTDRFCGEAAEWQSVLEGLSWETNRIGFSVPNLRFALRWAKQPAGRARRSLTLGQADSDVVASYDPVSRENAMPVPVEVLAQQVLQLSASDRARLLDQVISSLDADRERDARWNKLAAERDAEADADPSVLVQGPEAVARIRASLG